MGSRYAVCWIACALGRYHVLRAALRLVFGSATRSRRARPAKHGAWPTPVRGQGEQVMKSRGQGGRTRFGVDGRARDGVTALVGIALVVVAAFGACNLDDKNPPLPNEAPNRGQFVGGIAIGAGPGGTGGSGAGLSSTGSGGSNTGGSPANCACAVSYSVLSTGCSDCFTTSGLCTTEQTACNARPELSDAPNESRQLQWRSDLRARRPRRGRDQQFLRKLAVGCLNCGPTGQSRSARVAPLVEAARRSRQVVVLVALGGAFCFAACLDDKNPPLPNEAPNRHLIFTTPGAGGAGAGGGPSDNCECVSAYVVSGSACAQCVVNQLSGTTCSTALARCPPGSDGGSAGGAGGGTGPETCNDVRLCVNACKGDATCAINCILPADLDQGHINRLQRAPYLRLRCRAAPRCQGDPGATCASGSGEEHRLPRPRRRPRRDPWPLNLRTSPRCFSGARRAARRCRYSSTLMP